MFTVIDIKEALALEKTLFIDVRSPSEYEDGTILGAINIPILDDSERAIIGTIYKKESKDKATVTGLNLVSHKLPNLYETIRAYSKEYDYIIIFCWRGGMRSRSVCNLLSMLDIPNIYQLKDGYKGYRRHVINYLENDILKYHFIVLHGVTGVGKTHILEELKKEDIPILNLEEMAQNSGSVFGDLVFEKKPPSQKNFESLLFHKMHSFKESYIFIESESKRIGNVQIPDHLYHHMMQKYHILIETNLENRVNVILKDYIHHLDQNHEKIKKSLDHLRKRLGNKWVDTLIQKVDEKNYSYVIEYLMKHYYDPLYKYSIEQYEYDLVIEYKYIKEAVTKLKEFIKNTLNH
ncbi:tRNA 2-selenouridine(34) synthase MnmH [Inediibacterium massiliense]|uniref:tRNA 2-selenouridine(34) synthase MnmH n=1 Tax=Inediibacterium massiliense TaxID=1658111 RepID=UPI0006B4242A|nr:tRNA 2-selenouridine(34) synthase MnmH [Inediibacterium massiliense]